MSSAPLDTPLAAPSTGHQRSFQPTAAARVLASWPLAVRHPEPTSDPLHLQCGGGGTEPVAGSPNNANTRTALKRRRICYVCYIDAVESVMYYEQA